MPRITGCAEAGNDFEEVTNMPKCKICGVDVTAGVVVHRECWVGKGEELAEIFCDNYCKWPQIEPTEDALNEHCNRCGLVKLFNLVVGK